MATPSLPMRKAANINVSPVGNQGNAGQTNILPQHQVAQPFGSVSSDSAYKRTTAPAGPSTVPVNDKDAGNGTGNVRNGSNSGGVGLWAGGAD